MKIRRTLVWLAGFFCMFALRQSVVAAEDVVLANDVFTLRVGTDAIVKSLRLNSSGEELLDLRDPVPLFSVTQERPYNNEVKLIYPNARTAYPAKSLRLDGDRLVVGFNIAPYEAVVRVRKTPDYIAFTLDGFIVTEKSYPLCPTTTRPLDMDAPPVEEFRVVQLPVKERANFGEWLNCAWDGDAAVAVMSTSPHALVSSERRGSGRILLADAMRTVRLVGTGAAVVVDAGRKRFLDRVEALERDFGLPSGVKNRRNPLVNASIYWTAGLTAANVDEHIALAKKGGFRMMLLLYRNFFTNLGDYEYDLKRFPGGKAQIAETLAKIRAAGITPGIHVLHTHVWLGKNTKLVSPSADPRLAVKDRFTLARPVGKDDTELEVLESTHVAPRFRTCRVLKFGGELITYERTTSAPPWRFLGCVRGAKHTTRLEHAAGEVGGVLDVSEFGGGSAYISQNSDLQDVIADAIADVWSAGFGFIYFDGSEGVQPPFGFHVGNAQHRVWKKLVPEPFLAEGAAKTHFGWHMLSGANAFDIFAPEEFKQAIVDYPLMEAPLMEREMSRCNFGWWGFWHPGEDIRGRSTMGTQLDHLEYGTSKAAAWNSPATVQINLNSVNRHPRAADCFEVMRRWEDVRSGNLLTEREMQDLRDPKREFHLFMDASGKYELREIEMLSVPASAKGLRAFVFTRGGRRVVAYWHTSDKGSFSVELGKVRRLDAGNLAYVETDLTTADVKAAFAAARAVPDIDAKKTKQEG